MHKSLCLFAAIALTILFSSGLRSRAYVLEGQQWSSGTSIVMNLQLSSAVVPYPTPGLQDGTASWNLVAEAALADWNQYLNSVQFAFNTTTLTPAAPDHINSVFFSSNVYGQSFNSGTLGITIRYYSGSTSRTSEADTIINTAFQWDSYRGPLKPDPQGDAYIFDLRRVLDHELGHNLGLTHPDLATPSQFVTAIMNSITSDLDHIELDDISGVWSMYGQKSPSVPVTVVASPTAGGTVTGGGNLPVNTPQTLTATPAAGYTFQAWEDGSTNTTRSIKVPVGGATYTATFLSSLDSWTISSSAAPGQVGGPAALVFDNGTFRAFGPNGMATSPDGVAWTSHLAATQQTYNPYAVAVHSGTYVSVANSGGIYSSSDGVNWTDRSPGNVGDFHAVTYGAGVFVAVGTPLSTGDPALIYSSPNGVTWTARTQGVTTLGELQSVIYANGIFLTVGFTNAVFTSTDGITWNTVVVPNINSFYKVAYGKGHFLACQPDGVVASTVDGVTWTPGASAYFTSFSIGYGNGLFFGWEDNQFFTSTDEQNWPFHTLADNTYNEVFVYGNGRFVSTGQNGIAYSGPVPVVATTLPVINSATAKQGTSHTALSYQITAANTPLAFNAVGLPTGLSVNVQTGAITGTPTVTGTFPVTLFATNDAGSGTAALSLTVTAGATPQPYSDWATAHNVTGSMSDTPRHDGIPNLLKYLFDIDPTAPVNAAARASLPVVGTAASDTLLTLTFPENKSLQNVAVAVETSTNLTTWSAPDESAISDTGLVNANGDHIMIAQVAVTPNNEFIRLVVTPQ